MRAQHELPRLKSVPQHKRMILSKKTPAARTQPNDTTIYLIPQRPTFFPCSMRTHSSDDEMSGSLRFRRCRCSVKLDSMKRYLLRSQMMRVAAQCSSGVREAPIETLRQDFPSKCACVPIYPAGRS